MNSRFQDFFILIGFPTQPMLSIVSRDTVTNVGLEEINEIDKFQFKPKLMPYQKKLYNKY